MVSDEAKYMTALQPGWYILLYHEVSWEENAYVHGLGGTYAPDVFRDHLMSLSRHGPFVSIDEGLERFESGTITKPMFSLWFDDGLAGVARYAVPLLERYGAVGGYSICSRFVDRREMFWRFQLSYLRYVDGLKVLRSRLAELGHRRSVSVKRFCLDNFSKQVLDWIDATFERFTSPAERADGFRIFETADGVRKLEQAGWTIANHTAAHYPVGDDSAGHLFEEQFSECERFCRSLLGEATRFWVLPFGQRESDRFLEAFAACGEDRYLVLVGNRVNRRAGDRRVLYRFAVPDCTGDELVAFLKSGSTS